MKQKEVSSIHYVMHLQAQKVRDALGKNGIIFAQKNFSNIDKSLLTMPHIFLQLSLAEKDWLLSEQN
jgi:hypothetical protein